MSIFHNTSPLAGHDYLTEKYTNACYFGAVIDKDVDDKDPTPGPQFSRYREHPGIGYRKKVLKDRSKIKAARKSNTSRIKRGK